MYVVGDHSARHLLIGGERAQKIQSAGTGDWINARGGNDFIAANAGNDSVIAGAGDDVVLGQGGRDVLQGRAGDDVLDGAIGHDRLFGGDGDDTIIGGDGNDVLYGDNAFGRRDGAVGNDVFVFDADDGRDKVWDFDTDHDQIALTGPVVALDGTDENFSISYFAKNTLITYFDTEIRLFHAHLTADDISFLG